MSIIIVSLMQRRLGTDKTDIKHHDLPTDANLTYPKQLQMSKNNNVKKEEPKDS
uniref:Uncharacterized protein n=1 Tax=Arundo donax TaxID=35708 RepID=A0A0A9FI47_ARUDO